MTDIERNLIWDIQPCTNTQGKKTPPPNSIKIKHEAPPELKKLINKALEENKEINEN